MGRRITLYDAALVEAFKTGGEPARLVAIGAFNKVDAILRTISTIRSLGASNLGLTGSVVLITLVVGWAFSGFALSFWSLQPVLAGLAIAGVLFGLAFVCLAVWDIMIGLEKIGYVPGPLKAHELAPFHALRKRCANRLAQAYDDDGKQYDSPMYGSVWSLILFSQLPEHRKFRLQHSMDIIAAQPLIDFLTSQELVEAKATGGAGQTAPPVNTVLNFFRTKTTIIVQYIFHTGPQPVR
jgi:hypothetical protein